MQASKKKSDQIDARTIADMVRCDWLPACYVRQCVLSVFLAPPKFTHASLVYLPSESISFRR